MITEVNGVSELDPLEVINRFRANPAMEKELINVLAQKFANLDVSSIDVLVEEMKFYGSKSVEPFPIDVLDLLPEETAIWSSNSYGTDASWQLFGVLWFYVSIVSNFSGETEEVTVWSSDSFNEAVEYLEELSNEEANEFANYVYGENMNLKPVDAALLGSLRDARLIYERVEPATLSSQGIRDHRLELYERFDGSFVVLAVHFNEPQSWIDSESADDGRDFIANFW
jgi:hypothetical protein